MVEFDDIAELDVLETVEDDDVVLCNEVGTVLDLGHSVVFELVAEEGDL